MIDIYFIFAKKCDECKSMRQAIKSISRFYEVEEHINLQEYDCGTDDAVDIALKYDISQVPGCAIDGVVIEGDNFDKKLLQKIIQEKAASIQNDL